MKNTNHKVLVTAAQLILKLLQEKGEMNSYQIGKHLPFPFLHYSIAILERNKLIERKGTLEKALYSAIQKTSK